MSKDEKTCRRCNRILVGKSILGVCPNCVNKYGTPVAAIGTVILIVGGRFIAKNGRK